MNPLKWIKRLFVSTQYKRVVRDTCNLYREAINVTEDTMLEPNIQKAILDILEANQEPLRIIVEEFKKLKFDQIPMLGKLVNENLQTKGMDEKRITIQRSMDALVEELKAEA